MKKYLNPAPLTHRTQKRHTCSNNVNWFDLKSIDGHRVTDGSMNNRYM